MSNLKIYSPYSLNLIEELPFDNKEKVEQSLSTAYHLFHNRKKWLPPYERIAILKKVASIMKSRVEELTKTAAGEGGKPYQDSKVEVLRAISGVEIAMENISHAGGKEIPMGLTQSSLNHIAYTTREPIGVVSSISAFNHPINLIIHQTVTAIASGCPVIIKPALTTPLSCIKLCKIFYEAGLPKEWCQFIIAENEDAEKLVTDKRINYFSFIGSQKVGWYLRSKLASGTRCALEHGGVAPAIIDKDVDLNEVVPSLLKGAFYHAGQVCVSVQRVFAHESICDELCKKMTEGAEKLIVGDPLNPDTEIGPLILPREVDRVDSWINEAINEGAKKLCGGEKIGDTCYKPTILLNPSSKSKVSTMEVFGPLVCIYPYTDREEAIHIANSLDVHFQAAVYSKNIDVALECVQKLNATAVMVNDNTAFRVDWMPFGGRDASGIGMGGIPYTMHEMTREKLMVIKSKLI